MRGGGGEKRSRGRRGRGEIGKGGIGRNGMMGRDEQERRKKEGNEGGNWSTNWI